MDQAKKDYLAQWYYKADEDVLVLEELLSREANHYTGAICFHAQQAVEKYLKLFLIFHDVEFKKVHDVDYLLDECKKIDALSFEDVELKSLTDYGVAVRYPDDFINPSLADAEYYSEVAQQVKRIIYKLVVL